jgi:hypothetical protein
MNDFRTESKLTKTDFGKIGAFIQGPVVSFGRSGASLGATKDLKEHWIEFNSLRCIENNYEILKKLFDVVVVVVWKTDEIYYQDSRIAKSDILIIDVPNTDHNRSGSGSSRNKHLQYFSSSMGAKYLFESGCSYSFKLRSDQTLNFQKAIEQLTIFKNEKIQLAVPKQESVNYRNIQDFYFWGRSDFLNDFLFELSENKELSKSVHLDIYFQLFRKHARYSPAQIDQKIGSEYFDLVAYPMLRKGWTKFFSRYEEIIFFPRIAALSWELWASLEWRGESNLDTNHLNNVFGIDAWRSQSRESNKKSGISSLVYLLLIGRWHGIIRFFMIPTVLVAIRKVQLCIAREIQGILSK